MQHGCQAGCQQQVSELRHCPQKRKELAQDLAQARAAHFGEAVEKGADALVDSAAAAAQALHMPSEQLQRERRERAEKRAKRVAKRRRQVHHLAGWAQGLHAYLQHTSLPVHQCKAQTQGWISWACCVPHNKLAVHVLGRKRHGAEAPCQQ